ncbi:hypothetical protein ABT299_30230 [Spirillospora sp. NPDC000708]
MTNEEFLKTRTEPNPDTAVLADIAAKRRVLARHCPGERGLYAHIKGDWCAGCGTEGEDAWPRTEDITTARNSSTWPPLTSTVPAPDEPVCLRRLHKTVVCAF